jgi:CheY-like chemotaxis protein
MTALRILIAEDNAMIAMFPSDLLGALGHNVGAATETNPRRSPQRSFTAPTQ